jgi:predicted nucleotidyltransferase
MSKILLKDTRFKSEIHAFYKANHDCILDIIVFGSSLKGKENPNDIDILIIYTDTKSIDKGYALKKSLKAKGYEADITEKTYHELFSESFQAREAFLSEGYSLIKNKSISGGLGFTNLSLFRYELKGFSKTDRMRFYYSLNGRGDKQGILARYYAIKFSESIILCPMENLENLKEYFVQWNIKFEEFPILIPQRMANFLRKNNKK